MRCGHPEERSDEGRICCEVIVAGWRSATRTDGTQSALNAQKPQKKNIEHIALVVFCAV
jgi:hypothetical protein